MASLDDLLKEAKSIKDSAKQKVKVRHGKDSLSYEQINELLAGHHLTLSLIPGKSYRYLELPVGTGFEALKKAHEAAGFGQARHRTWSGIIERNGENLQVYLQEIS